jgi:hypothetical protein
VHFPTIFRSSAAAAATASLYVSSPPLAWLRQSRCPVPAGQGRALQPLPSHPPSPSSFPLPAALPPDDGELLIHSSTHSISANQSCERVLHHVTEPDQYQIPIRSLVSLDLNDARETASTSSTILLLANAAGGSKAIQRMMVATRFFPYTNFYFQSLRYRTFLSRFGRLSMSDTTLVCA